MSRKYDVDLVVEAVTKGFDDLDGELSDMSDTMDQTEKNTRRTSKAMSGFKSIAQGLVNAGVVAAIGQQLLAFGKASITTASEVEEMQSKFNTVFGELGGEVTAELDKFAEAANRSTTDLQGFAATLQDTFVPMGFARDEAADFSVKLVKLAEDLGSFNNLPTDQVIGDIQSALVGNTETLRKYGVVANQARIEQEAFTTGLWDGVGAIDAQAKAQAIYQLTLKGTTDAQGDAIRTSDSYANQQRGLEAAMKELRVTLGTMLIPVMSELVEIATEAAKALNEAGKITGEYGDEVEGTVDKNLQAAQSMEDLIAQGQRLIETREKEGQIAFRVVGALDDYRDSLRKTAMAIAENSNGAEDMRKNLEAAFGPDLFRNVDEMGLTFIDLGDGVSVYVKELERASNQANRFSEDLDDLRRIQATQNEELTDGVGHATDYGTELEYLAQIGRANMGPAMENLTEIEAEHAAEMDEAAEAALRKAEALAALNKRTGTYFDKALAAGDEAATLEQQLYDAGAAAGLSAEDMSILAAATGDFTDAEIEAALQAAIMREQIRVLAEAVADGETSASQAVDALQLLRDGEAATGQEAILMAEAIDRGAGSMANADVKAQNLATTLNNMPTSRTFTYKLKTDKSNFTLPPGVSWDDVSERGGGVALATGGAFAAGDVRRVGENNQPELVMSGGRLYMIPGERGRVFSNQQSQQMMRGRGMTVNGPLIGTVTQLQGEDGQEFTRRVNDDLITTFRRYGDI